MADKVAIALDGISLEVQAGITVKKALELNGYKVAKYPEPASLFTPCETGGCWSCAVEVNGQPQRACVTSVSDGLTLKRYYRIITFLEESSLASVGIKWEGWELPGISRAVAVI